MKDITGEPLTIAAVENALRVCTLQLSNILKLPPELAVELLTIRLALIELYVAKRNGQVK